MVETEIIFDGGPEGFRVRYLAGDNQCVVEAMSPKPRAIGGPLALHVSIPIHPRSNGTLPGMSKIHLTYERGRRVRVALVPVRDLALLFTYVSHAVTGVANDISAEDLAAGGATATEVRRRMFREFRGRLRIDRAAAETWKQEHVKVGVRQELHDVWATALGPLVPVASDSPLALAYRSAEPDGDHDRPLPDHQDVARLLRPHVPPEFWGKLGVVLGELGACVKEPLATWVRKAPAFRINHRNKVVPA